MVLKQDHAYFFYEIYRCSWASQFVGDPPCAVDTYMKSKLDPSQPSVDKLEIPEDQLQDYEEDLEADSIDNWIREKMVTLKLINQKIDFISFNDTAVRYNEVYIPAVPLGNGAYSDTGYRLRFNEFLRQDGWFIKNNLVNKFFDYVFFSSDTYPNAPPSNQRLIAEMYFRLDSNQVNHKRDAFFIMDLISKLGGVERLLLKICAGFLGGFASLQFMIDKI